MILTLSSAIIPGTEAVDINDVRTEQPEAPSFRMTPQREAVLAAVRSSRVHPSAEDVLRDVRTTSPGIGVATVYRTLDLLVRSGVVAELRLGDESVTRYDGNVARHDHVVCSACGRVFDVDVTLPRSVLAAAEGQVDVDIDGYDLQFRGRCGRCPDADDR